MDDDGELEDGKLRSLFPSSFGGGEKGTDIDAQIERSKRPTESRKIKQEESDSKSSNDGIDSDDEDSEEDEDDEFPTSHELIFRTQERAVTTITVDPAGSRMITGSTDSTIKLHDFASMTPTTLRAFKSVDPSAGKASANAETHPIHVAKFNPNSPSIKYVIGISK